MRSISFCLLALTPANAAQLESEEIVNSTCARSLSMLYSSEKTCLNNLLQEVM
jgi:hypothetical protein